MGTSIHVRAAVFCLIALAWGCGGKKGDADGSDLAETLPDALDDDAAEAQPEGDEPADDDGGTGDAAGDTQEEESVLPAGPWCPDALACGMVTDDGYLGCLDGTEFPAGSTTGCHNAGVDCTGNQGCLFTNVEQTESICVENCGACAGALTCQDVTGDGYLGCLEEGGEVPSDAVEGCHRSGGCEGNATCFYTNTARTASVCIENCSPCNPADPDACPAGQVCDDGFCVPAPCDPEDPDACPTGEICVDGSCILDAGPGPGVNPGVTCSNLPPMRCEGTGAYCGELIRFDPVQNDAYIDYPENGETTANQYRSWLRRDLVMLIQYATAVVACKAADWEFGNGGPVGLIDMSEQNGAIPGTSVGDPGHPEGTHTGGRDIDLAYYQAGTADNRARPVCQHMSGGSDAYHCTGPARYLDPWRQALFFGALCEHSNVRVIGVDGKVGPTVDHAIDVLCAGEWITSYACSHRKLTYEVTNEGRGWYYFHHHHTHVSFSPPTYPTGLQGPAADPSRECLVPGCDAAPLLLFYAGEGLPLPPSPFEKLSFFPAD